jgi:hypothetical protein
MKPKLKFHFHFEPFLCLTCGIEITSTDVVELGRAEPKKDYFVENAPFYWNVDDIDVDTMHTCNDPPPCKRESRHFVESEPHEVMPVNHKINSCKFSPSLSISEKSIFVVIDLKFSIN